MRAREKLRETHRLNNIHLTVGIPVLSQRSLLESAVGVPVAVEARCTKRTCARTLVEVATINIIQAADISLYYGVLVLFVSKPHR